MSFFREARLEIRLIKDDLSGYYQKIIIKDLRISFTVKKTESWSLNTANIKIWNLSADNRNLLQDYGDNVRLFAGYESDNTEQLVFVGDTTKVSHSFNQPEIVTSIECGDGELLLNQKIVSVSFAEGTSIRTAIINIANQANIDIAYFERSQNLSFINGKSFVGIVKDGLDECTKALNLTYSIQNGQLYITPEKGARNIRSHVINANNGMIGVPELFSYKEFDIYTNARKQGWKVKTLLRPEIIPGDPVNMQSERVDLKGSFYVDSLVHSGDTWSRNWESTFEVVLI